MKPDEIVQKVVDGELSGEKLSEAVSSLSVEDQAEVNRLAKDSAEQSLSQASALRKERDRAEGLKTQAEKEAEEAAARAQELAQQGQGQGEGGQGGQGGNSETPPAQQPPAKDPTMSQFRQEQLDKAKNRFKSDFSHLSDEQMTAVMNRFDQTDSGRVDADNIYQELIGAYAYVNRDALVTAEKEKREREAAAAEEGAQGANGTGDAPPAGSDPEKHPKYVKELAKQAGISEDAAAKVATEGNSRVYQ